MVYGIVPYGIGIVPYGIGIVPYGTGPQGGKTVCMCEEEACLLQKGSPDIHYSIETLSLL